MLLDLPPELIEHILRLALPSSHTHPTYQNRQALLRSCCLVSFTLRNVAQPLLEEVAHLRSSKKREQYWKRCEERRPELRQLEVDGQFNEHGVLPPDILRHCQALRYLCVSGIQTVDLSGLAGLPNLRFLRLMHASVWTTRSIMPHVVELSYEHGSPDSPVVRGFITSAVFPSLRLLSSNVHPTDTALLEHLDGFICTSGSNHSCRALSRYIPPSRILARLSFGLFARPPLDKHPGSPHLFNPATLASHLAVHSLATFLTKTNCMPALLPLLFLPAAAAPPSLLHQCDSALREAVDGLLEVCRSRGIPVDYENSRGVEGAESNISPRFWKYAQEVKASEEAQNRS
ncbi:hypothetical protein JCM8097_003991 [Rhodosporidiobolus ruineniae]